MIYNVRFANDATFISSAKNVTVKKYDADGNELHSAPFRGKALPKVGRWYRPAIWQNQVAINMSQDELNKLVPDLFIYDNDGTQILNAPIKNPAAKFWTKIPPVFIQYTGKTFNEDVDIDRFWIRCFEADPQFSVGKEINEAFSGKTKFSVTKVSDDNEDRFKDVDETSKATALFHKIDFEKKKQILRAFGFVMTNPDIKQVDRSLMEKITVDKNRMTDSGERFIDLFIRFAETAPEDLNIRGYFQAAKAKKIITRIPKKNQYFYGEIPLGRTEEEVIGFLKEKENAYLLDEIVKKTSGYKDE